MIRLRVKIIQVMTIDTQPKSHHVETVCRLNLRPKRSDGPHGQVQRRKVGEGRAACCYSVVLSLVTMEWAL